MLEETESCQDCGSTQFRFIDCENHGRECQELICVVCGASV